MLFFLLSSSATGISGTPIPICRLWAEVFHVTTSSSGSVKWTQVSEDLVPVNITCILPNVDKEQQQQQQQQQMVVYHITAYNSQVDKKILDVRLVQPGKKTFYSSRTWQSLAMRKWKF